LGTALQKKIKSVLNVKQEELFRLIPVYTSVITLKLQKVRTYMMCFCCIRLFVVIGINAHTVSDIYLIVKEKKYLH